MTTLIILLIFAVLFALSYLVSKPDHVICAEAGKTADLLKDVQTKLHSYAKPLVLEDDNGRMINTHKMIRVHVSGSCMMQKGINDGDEVLVDRISQSQLPNVLKKGDILLLLHPEKNVYKLRVFEEETNEAKLHTYRYEQGKEHRSSLDHSYKDVIGVVRYVVPQPA